MVEPIKFYGRSAPCFFCSNFYPAGFKLDGRWWSTSEHYFQAMKFKDRESQELVRGQSSPNLAAKLGRDRSMPLRKDWESTKDSVMETALMAKFSQNADIREELLSTGRARLVEDSPIDSYWGNGPDGTGQNKLGCLLMKVRTRLSLIYGAGEF